MSQGLSTLDIVFAAVILFSVAGGIWKGLVRELLSLGFLVLAVVLALFAYQPLAGMLSRWVSSVVAARFAAFVLVFFIVLTVGALITWLIRAILVRGPLKAVDRILGGLFGTLRGLIIAGFLAFALLMFPVADRPLEQSRLAPIVLYAFNLAWTMLPQGLKQKIPLYPPHDPEKNNRNHRSI